MNIRIWPGVITAGLLLGAASLGGCGTGNTSTAGSSVPSTRLYRQAGASVGLGKILKTQNRGQIFGFDIDQNGDDGVLASSRVTNKQFVNNVSVETFDQNTGKITKSFARSVGSRNQYVVDGIFYGDVALVGHGIVPKGHLLGYVRYRVMNPVTAEKFTGIWSGPGDTGVLETAENQSTPTAALFGLELKKPQNPNLIVSNIAANTSKAFHLDPNLFLLGDGPELAEYTAANEAVIALSPDGGARKEPPVAPINVLIDMRTGKETQFTGFDEGTYGSGLVNGIAVDSSTGVEATTTNFNAQVEFYSLATQTGINAVQLPCTGSEDQENSGSGIASDPINHLFLVTEYAYCNGSKGSAIVVYDESGNLVETITGFPFVLGEPAPAINPSKRMGWALGGNGLTELRQFFY